MDSIHVVAGIIEKGAKVLAARRAAVAGDEGSWEFPGGKVEPGETPEQALERELEEELGVRIGTRWLLETIEHDYERFHLVMDCFVCHLTGDDEPQSLEHRELRWLGLPDLLSVDWLPADRKVVMLLGTYWSQAFEAEHL